ncbi:DUF4910 domain-containing protein [Streptantibioticus silvisoli]|uniref:DUF4910 domain-containing protein n=1 Tax=Streptantibioticus silvisoli TaxID=2705255 RepID=A0ABT6VV34_9ACTN|nr:DUF4910 domain-containing protein [Streptantibioticus silvisoli]MDI5962330.1 DUF4910 domain-containing protein [Streptantibioticus silvisoli]
MTADLTGLVAAVHRDLDTDLAMSQLRRLTGWDRYQGSAGLSAAAGYVAEQAERAGLTGVEIMTFPADGRTSWWTFTAPTSWTPRSARLSPADPAGPPLVDYPGQPYTLAANSAATAPVEAPLTLAGRAHWPPGSVILLDPGVLPDPELFARMRRDRARGFCVCTHPDRPDQAGRLELAPGSGLFAFSVPARTHAALSRARRVLVHVELDPAPHPMPVVTARTPTGDGDAELLLGAHLCHPAPSANDNGSGVVAALAAGRVLARRRLRRPVRLLWAPEFTGTAAYLHHTGRRPIAAVNLDMVGEDQRLCGGPLIVERSPEHLPHFLNALVDACVRALPPQARSYSGAVGCDTWAWRSTPFVGASDHAILADRAIGVPAVQLGHWPDRFNHSGADTLDKVDPAEIRRAAAIAAAALAAAAGADTACAHHLAAIVTRWTAHRMTACLPPHPAGADPADRLSRRWQFGRDALPTLTALGADATVLAAHAELLAGLHTTLAASVEQHPGPPRGPRGPALSRTWPGPFNLRAFMAAVPADDRDWLQREAAADRGGFYARAMALAQGIDAACDAATVRRNAAADSELDIDPAFARRYLTAMVRGGWAREDETA